MSLGMTVITNDDLQTIIAKWNEGEPLETIDDDCLIYTNFSGKVHRFTDVDLLENQKPDTMLCVLTD